jgi:hypothetical protein
MDLHLRISQLEAERDEWKHEAEKQTKLMKDTVHVLEQHVVLLMKQLIELRERRVQQLNSPLRSNSIAE